MYSKLLKYIEKNKLETENLSKSMEKLKAKIESHAKKDVEFLMHLQDIITGICAIAVTCCKSGKDRTSMSVTWEHARKQLKANEVYDQQKIDRILPPLRR